MATCEYCGAQDDEHEGKLCYEEIAERRLNTVMEPEDVIAAYLKAKGR